MTASTLDPTALAAEIGAWQADTDRRLDRLNPDGTWRLTIPPVEPDPAMRCSAAPNHESWATCGLTRAHDFAEHVHFAPGDDDLLRPERSWMTGEAWSELISDDYEPYDEARDDRGDEAVDLLARALTVLRVCCGEAGA